MTTLACLFWMGGVVAAYKINRQHHKSSVFAAFMDALTWPFDAGVIVASRLLFPAKDTPND